MGDLDKETVIPLIIATIMGSAIIYILISVIGNLS